MPWRITPWATCCCGVGATGQPVPRKPAAPPAPAAVRPAVRSLRTVPDRITLDGPYSEARVLTDARFADGSVRDASDGVALSVVDPRIAAVDESGTVRARGDG